MVRGAPGPWRGRCAPGRCDPTPTDMSPGRETSRTQGCLEHLRPGSERPLRLASRICPVVGQADGYTFDVPTPPVPGARSRPSARSTTRTTAWVGWWTSTGRWRSPTTLWIGWRRVTVLRRFTLDHDALIQLAESAQRTGVDPTDARTLLDCADEYGLPLRGPGIHPTRPLWSVSSHTHWPGRPHSGALACLESISLSVLSRGETSTAH
jgi:hypothetical protein